MESQNAKKIDILALCDALSEVRRGAPAGYGQCDFTSPAVVPKWFIFPFLLQASHICLIMDDFPLQGMHIKKDTNNIVCGLALQD